MRWYRGIDLTLTNQLYNTGASTMLRFTTFIVLLTFINLNDGSHVVRWNRWGRRIEKWGVYPDECYAKCQTRTQRILTSTLYVAENDEKCMSWANFVTRDYSTFNLMELTNWRHICKQPVIYLMKYQISLQYLLSEHHPLQLLQ